MAIRNPDDKGKDLWWCVGIIIPIVGGAIVGTIVSAFVGASIVQDAIGGAFVGGMMLSAGFAYVIYKVRMK